MKAQRSWVNFAMYISLFPQLIAGPIVRYADIEHQLALRNCTTAQITTGQAKAHEIVVYYDGKMAEGNPALVNTAYAITLKTPKKVS